MQSGEYILGQKIRFDRKNVPTVYGSAHRVEEEMGKTLEEMAADHKKRRLEQTMAQHQSAYGWRLSPEKLEQRANLVLRYKGVGPIWILKGNQWIRFKRCLDFKCPDLQVRCVDKNDDLHIFNPDEVTIATQSERTRHIADTQQKQLRRGVAMLRATAESIIQKASALEVEADRIDKLFRRAESEERRQKRRSRNERTEKYKKFVHQT